MVIFKLDNSVTGIHILFYILQAQEHEIFDLKPFFNSTHFTRANFVLDEERGVIRHRLAREGRMHS